MHLPDLHHAVTAHRGEFTCERINHRPQQTKTVHFAHTVTPPGDKAGLPAVGRLADFYGTFGSVLFYVDALTGEAAKHIVHPSQWALTHDDFNDWIEQLDEQERAEILPEWIDRCTAIGETPRSGNYILMVLEGDEAGKVFEFDHDGFEFTERAADLVAYVQRLLDLDAGLLLDIASHMRFIEADQVQWWILEMVDNRGNRVGTSA